MWSRLLAICLPYFQSEKRRRALAGVVLLVSLLLAINALNVVNSYTGRGFMTALAERQANRFFLFAGLFAGVFAISTVVEVFSRYVEQQLGLTWREWLTRRLLDRYLTSGAYRRLNDESEVDNPDARISLDVQTFTSTTLSIGILLVNGILTLVAFSGVLWLITPWLFLCAVGYALAGSVGTMLLGHCLVRLNKVQLRREADFRYGLGRLREHAEDIAQSHAEGEQKERLNERFKRVVENFGKIIRVSRNLGFFTTAYNYLPQIIPAAVVAPLYMRGSVEFGVVTQAAMAFAQVQGAFSLVVTQFQELTNYAAVVYRVGDLWNAIEPRPSLAIPTPQHDREMAAPGLRN